jgi:hypothetical protein
MIAGLLRRADSAAPAEDLSALAYALVGAAESLADWLVDHVAEVPDRTATRMMNPVWLPGVRIGQQYVAYCCPNVRLGEQYATYCCAFASEWPGCR